MLNRIATAVFCIRHLLSVMFSPSAFSNNGCLVVYALKVSLNALPNLRTGFLHAAISTFSFV